MAKRKKSAGRPTVITPEVLRKLEEVFAIGGTDSEACFYADISPTALYEYQEKTPGFAERKAALKERPILKARQTIVKGLDDDRNAQWYLERKRKDEFAVRTELTGKDGADLIPDKQSKEKADEALDAYFNGQDKGNTEIGEPEGTVSTV